MKTLKKILIALFGVTMIASFAACSDDDDDKKGGNSALIGTWKTTWEEDGDWDIYTITFNENGSGVWIDEWSEDGITGKNVINFNYTYKDNTIVVSYSETEDDRTTEETFIWNVVSLDKSKLIITCINEDGETEKIIWDKIR